MCNRRKQKNNTSGFTGVHWHKGAWVADISINGKKKHIGRFSDPTQASVAFISFAQSIRGEFFRKPKSDNCQEKTQYQPQPGDSARMP